jgi:DNA polymerase III subunit delta'
MEGQGRAESGAPPPRANPDLVGHDAIERELVRLCEAGRLPHAILFGGPRGIGKATLAFRLARFVLAGRQVPVGGASGLAIDPSSGVFRRVAAGAHADLFTVERIWDPQRRRLRGEILTEQTREIPGFLHLTPGEEGWRIVIIDGAEAMNRNAASALLKILEEPPPRSVLLLVSHNPGALLPTIRSRCRRFRLAAPAPRLVRLLLGRYRPRLEEAEAAALAALADGSIGRAIELADAGGLALYRSLVERLSELPHIDIRRLHAFVDSVAAAEADEAYRMVGELLLQCLARMAGTGRRGSRSPEATGENGVPSRLAARANPSRWARLRVELEENFAAVRELNLDRKQAMLGAFFAMEDAAR